MKRIFISAVASIFLSLNYGSAIAESILPIPAESNWFVAVEGGEWYPNAFHSTLQINNGSGAPAPYDKDIYSTKKNHEPVFGMTVGRRLVFDRRWFPAASLSLE